jgi:hypothetical protein
VAGEAAGGQAPAATAAQQQQQQQHLQHQQEQQQQQQQQQQQYRHRRQQQQQLAVAPACRQLNESAGHLLRAKVQGTDEGGVASGFACLSSPLLVSDEDIIRLSTRHATAPSPSSGRGLSAGDAVPPTMLKRQRTDVDPGAV